jgi:hypothetical protein
MATLPVSAAQAGDEPPPYEKQARGTGDVRSPAPRAETGLFTALKL